MCRQNNESTLNKVIKFFTPSFLFKGIFGIGTIYTLASLATKQPDFIVNKSADILVASADAVKSVGQEGIKAISSGIMSVSNGFYKAIWGSADNIKTHLLEYVAPSHENITIFSAVKHPFITFYNVSLEMSQWRIVRVDLVPFLLPRPLRHDNLVDGFFSYVLSDVYQDRKTLVNAMSNTKVYTNQWIYDQTVTKMVEINSSYSSADNILIQIKLMLISIVVITAIAALIFTVRILLQGFFNLLEAVYKRLYLWVYSPAANKQVKKSVTKTLFSDTESSLETTSQVKAPSLFLQNRIGKLDKRFVEKYRIIEFIYELFRGRYVFLVISLLTTRVGLLSFNYFILPSQVHNQLKDLCIGLLSHTQTVVGASQTELDVLFVMLSQRMTCWNALYGFIMNAPFFRFTIGFVVIVCYTYALAKLMVFMGFNVALVGIRDLALAKITTLTNKTLGLAQAFWAKGLERLGLRRAGGPPSVGRDPDLPPIAVRRNRVQLDGPTMPNGPNQNGPNGLNQENEANPNNANLPREVVIDEAEWLRRENDFLSSDEDIPLDLEAPAGQRRYIYRNREGNDQILRVVEDQNPQDPFAPLREEPAAPAFRATLEEIPYSPGTQASDALHMAIRPNMRQVATALEDEIIYNRAHGIESQPVAQGAFSQTEVRSVTTSTTRRRGRAEPFLLDTIQETGDVDTGDVVETTELNGSEIVLAPDSPFGGMGLL